MNSQERTLANEIKHTLMFLDRNSWIKHIVSYYTWQLHESQKVSLKATYNEKSKSYKFTFSRTDLFITNNSSATIYCKAVTQISEQILRTIPYYEIATMLVKENIREPVLFVSLTDTSIIVEVSLND